jgi:hypothetical protein
MKKKKDNRELTWEELEDDVQSRYSYKDPDFKLEGKWKEFVRNQDDFKIYLVDGSWVRNNLSVIFGHGGHGIVHEFIPNDEIWISSHHWYDNKFNHCECPCNKESSKVSENYFDSCVIHEITEFKEMKKGKNYWHAHQVAINKENEFRKTKRMKRKSLTKV